MSSEKIKLNIKKILDFVHNKGYICHRIYKVRGDVRFLDISGKNDPPEERVVIEIPIKYSVTYNKGGEIPSSNLKSSEQNSKHVDYWSLLGPKITDSDLICCGTENVTVFKVNGETKSYRVTSGLIDGDFDGDSENEYDSDFEINRTSSKTLSLEKRTDRLLASLEGGNEREQEVQNFPDEEAHEEEQKSFSFTPSSSGENEESISSQPLEIVFEDKDGTALTDEDLSKETSPVIQGTSEESDEESDEEKESDVESDHENERLQSKIIDLNRVDSEISIDLGDFYLLMNLMDFYEQVGEMKEKVAQFYKILKEEEITIRKNRLDNLLVALASLNQTITDSFNFYLETDSRLRSELDKLTQLYDRTKEAVSKASKLSKEKKKSLLELVEEIRKMIKEKRQGLAHIRDILNSMLGKLEGDIERISARCAPLKEEEKEEIETEEKEEIEPEEKTLMIEKDDEE